MRGIVKLLAPAATVAVVLLAALGGCVQVGGKEPLIQGPLIGDGGYAGSPGPDVANIPPGPDHDPCRLEMDRALRRIDGLRKDLADCKSDREKDKEEWKLDKKKLERERDLYKEERDRYKKQLEKLTS